MASNGALSYTQHGIRISYSYVFVVSDLSLLVAVVLCDWDRGDMRRTRSVETRVGDQLFLSLRIRTSLRAVLRKTPSAAARHWITDRQTARWLHDAGCDVTSGRRHIRVLTVRWFIDWLAGIRPVRRVRRPCQRPRVPIHLFRSGEQRGGGGWESAFLGDGVNHGTEAAAFGDRVLFWPIGHRRNVFSVAGGSLSADRQTDRRADIRLVTSRTRLTVDRSKSQWNCKASLSLSSLRCRLAGILLLRRTLRHDETLFGIGRSGRTETAAWVGAELPPLLMRSKWRRRLYSATPDYVADQSDLGEVGGLTRRGDLSGDLLNVPIINGL